MLTLRQRKFNLIFQFFPTIFHAGENHYPRFRFADYAAYRPTCARTQYVLRNRSLQQVSRRRSVGYRCDSQRVAVFGLRREGFPRGARRHSRADSGARYMLRGAVHGVEQRRLGGACGHTRVWPRSAGAGRRGRPSAEGYRAGGAGMDEPRRHDYGGARFVSCDCLDRQGARGCLPHRGGADVGRAVPSGGLSFALRDAVA